jgi:hypothetical protein
MADHGGSKPHRSTTPAKTRPPSTFGTLRPEPRNRMYEGVLAPRQDACAFNRDTNYRSHATTRHMLTSYGLNPKTGERLMYNAFDMSVTHRQPAPELHFSIRQRAQQIMNNSTSSGVGVGAIISSRPVSPSASFRAGGGGGAGAAAATASTSVSSSGTSSHNASFSAASIVASQQEFERSATPKLCRYPQVTSGKFQDVTQLRRSATPVTSRPAATQLITPAESRVQHNTDVRGGFCSGSWREVERWVTGLRNDARQFKKRPLPSEKTLKERAALASGATVAAADETKKDGADAAVGAPATAAAAPAAP